VTPAAMRGAAYGLRQGLDSVGAVLGPLLAIGSMIWFANNLRAAMWIAVVPAFAAVALLVICVHEPKDATRRTFNSVLMPADVRELPRAFWFVVVLAALFTLARFSDAFLLLRGENVGLAPRWMPAVLVVMNVFYASAAYPAGVSADRMGKRALLLSGLMVLIAADVLLALARSPALVFAGAALWGLHMALTQGLFAKLIADTAASHLRGTAFGIFHLVTGVALLAASALAGLLWNARGPRATFFVGGLFATGCAIGLMSVMPRRKRATA